MVERSPVLDAACHALLLVGVAAVCVPLYLAFVAGSLTIEQAKHCPHERSAKSRGVPRGTPLAECVIGINDRTRSRS